MTADVEKERNAPVTLNANADAIKNKFFAELIYLKNRPIYGGFLVDSIFSFLHRA